MEIQHGINKSLIGAKRPMVAVREKRYQCFAYGKKQELRIPLGINSLKDAYLVTL